MLHPVSASTGAARPVAPRLLLLAVLAFLLWLCLAVLGASAATAVPAAPAVGTTTQPDGTTFASRLFGDEWANGLETADGYTVVQEPRTGVWQYATRAAGNRLRASGRVVGRDGPGRLPKHLRDEAAIQEGTALSESTPLPSPMEAPASTSLSEPSLVTTSTVTRKSLVLLASFTDQPSLGTTVASWHDRFFGPAASVKDYFEEVSYGRLTFAPAAETEGTVGDGVVGWLPLDMAHPDGDMQAAREMVKAAVVAADPYVDYASFDTNGDGVLAPSELHVTVVAAGLEGAYPGTGKKVWGHRWSLHGAGPPVVDGTYVTGSGSSPYVYEAGYTAFGEMHDAHQATVGIMVHELGHDLGLPDLYDTKETKTSSGVGNWSVMAGGSWGSVWPQYLGTTPTHPDAWSKSYQRWTTPLQVTTSTLGMAVNAAASASAGNVALQIRENPGGTGDWGFLGRHAGAGEYFLIENRQRTSGSYDASLPGEGMLVWHVNEAQRHNEDDANRLVDVVEADGQDHLDIAPGTTGANRGDAGDPYPGTSNNRMLSFTTTPDSRLNVTGGLSGVTVEAVSDSGATMTADVYIPTANDAFAGAPAVTTSSYATTQRITEATRQTGEPTACGVERSVWFAYTSASNATVTVTTAGTAFDTALGVFTGSAVGSLSNVACNGDDPAGGTTSALSFSAEAGQTYYVQTGNDAAAPNAVGDLALSIEATPTPTPPGAPTGVSAAAGDTTATVTWTAPASDGGAAITGYTVTATPGGHTATAPADTTEITVPGLTNGTTYTFTVTATNDVGEGPASEPSPAVLVMAALTPPSAPLTPFAVAAEQAALVTWLRPVSDGGSAITGYTVTATPGGHTATAPADTTEITVPGLTNGTTYTFTVTATNDVGEGPASEPSLAVTPLDVTPPTVRMKSPKTPFVLKHSIRATWGATDPSGVASYDVRWRRAALGGSFEKWVRKPAWQGHTGTRIFLATQPGYRYCFAVRAVDTAGNRSTWTRQRCTTTPMDNGALVHSAAWVQKGGKSAIGYYRRSYSVTSLRGSTLTVPSVTMKRLSLVATRCAGCGKVKVVVDGVRTIVNLDAPSTQRRALIPIGVYPSVTDARVRIRVLTTDKPVEIDGLAAATR